MEWSPEQIAAALGGLYAFGQGVGMFFARREARQTRDHLAERSLDPSEVKLLRQYTPALHQIHELDEQFTKLDAAIAGLRSELKEGGLDPSELRKVRVGVVAAPDGGASELHQIKSKVTALVLWRDVVTEKLAAMETERREQSRRVDDNIESLRKELRADREDLRAEVRRVGADTVEHVERMVNGVTEFLGTLRASGVRGLTPPQGSALAAKPKVGP